MNMRIEYRRDLQHSWMILSGGNIPGEDAYSVRMLTENRIDGLLPCKTVSLDGELRFYYDISSRHTLASLLETEPASRKLLEWLVASMAKVMERLSEYLLDPDGLLLDPQYLYCDPEKTEIRFCWYPGTDMPFSGQAKELGKALLPLLEQTDRAGVVIGYRFYQCCETGELTVDTLRGLLRQRTIESGSRLVTKEEIERAAVLDSFFNEEEEPENMPLGKRIKAWFSGKKKKREERKKRKKPLFDKEFKDVYNTNTEPEQTGSEYVDTAFGENSNTVFQQIPDTSLRQQSGDPETMLLTPDMLIPQDEQTWVLKIKEKHEEEREILLTKEVYLVGKTGSGVNLQLASSTVSRLHAKLEKNGENWLINDINSKNGTKIIRQTPDGQRESLLQPGETVILKEGDVIWFADVMCVMTRR